MSCTAVVAVDGWKNRETDGPLLGVKYARPCMDPSSQLLLLDAPRDITDSPVQCCKASSRLMAFPAVAACFCAVDWSGSTDVSLTVCFSVVSA